MSRLFPLAVTENTISHISLPQTRPISRFPLKTTRSLGYCIVRDPIPNLKSAFTDMNKKKKKKNRSTRLRIEMTIFYQNFNGPKTPLASPLGVGTIIRFISTSIDQEVKQELDNSAFFLYHDDRVILVATLRFKQAIVTFNTKTEANTWG